MFPLYYYIIIIIYIYIYIYIYVLCLCNFPMLTEGIPSLQPVGPIK